MKIYRLMAAASLAGMLVLSACSGPVKDDRAGEFVEKASVANLFEIKTSELALQRSQNAEIRAFAQSMVTDHTKAGSELEAALSTAKSKLMPATALDDAHQKMYDDLANAKAEEFDDKYIDIQTKAHDEALALFKDYSDGGTAGPIKDFAASTIPTLEAHKAHVDKVDDVTHSGQTDSSAAADASSLMH